MILNLHLEVVLALAYALFLVSVAALLEFLAQRSQKRAEGYRNTGFIHFRELDDWQCPVDQRLLPFSAQSLAIRLAIDQVLHPTLARPLTGDTALATGFRYSDPNNTHSEGSDEELRLNSCLHHESVFFRSKGD